MSAESSHMPAEPVADLELLRRFEPQLRLTRGEHFQPMGIDTYLGLTDLVARRAGKEPEVVVPRPAVTQEVLAKWGGGPADAVSYLQFVRRPLNALELVRFRTQQSPSRQFHRGTLRLARVGLAGRLLDAAFALSFLARGRVPGGVAAAAAATNRQTVGDDLPVYYGRVTRTPSYTVLQYYFFYAYNDYRSHYRGANDHEGDWELVSLYLSEDRDEGPTLEWAAFAAHDRSGPDLRRRWDDPELERVGEHPVLYVGAGSHAGFFAPGDYLIRIELRPLARLREHLEELRDAWRWLLRQRGSVDSEPEDRRLALAFVDYARGDGRMLGPRTEHPFGARLVEEQPALLEYAGLWGRYSQDFLRGEDAPTGPRFNPDGSLRTSWYDPVGWAGLHGVPPLSQEAEMISEELEKLVSSRLATEEAAAAAAEAEGLGVRLAALEQLPAPPAELEGRAVELEKATRRAQALLRELGEQDRLIEALQERRTQLLAGEREDPRAHLRQPAIPETAEGPRLRRLAETWSALSAGLLLLGGVAVAGVFRVSPLPLLLLLGGFIFVESLFSRRLVVFVHALVLGLALVTLAILVWEFWWPIFIALTAALGVYLIWSNLAELRGR